MLYPLHIPDIFYWWQYGQGLPNYGLFWISGIAILDILNYTPSHLWTHTYYQNLVNTYHILGLPADLENWKTMNNLEVIVFALKALKTLKKRNLKTCVCIVNYCNKMPGEILEIPWIKWKFYCLQQIWFYA